MRVVTVWFVLFCKGIHINKPPLCKGRWHGEAVTKGICDGALRLILYKPNYPPVSLRSTAPVRLAGP